MKKVRPESQAKPEPENLPGIYSRPSVLFLLAIGIVFFAEILVMLLLNSLPPLDPATEALIDSILLSLLIVPALYFFVYRPLEANINIRRETELQQRHMLEVDRLKSQFISTAAHELGTPLTSVIGYSELLLATDDLDEADRQRYLQTILDKALVLDRLTDDLLDLSRVESGQVVRIQKEECLLLPIVESVIHYSQYSFSQRVIAAELPADILPLQVDAVRIGQVLENLISNALKYSPEGGAVKIVVDDSPQEVAITVTDQGIGMTRAQRERVFEKFYRADHSDTATDGLGLGMTIVKEIVDGHGGELRIDSILGQGTSVQVTLPRD